MSCCYLGLAEVCRKCTGQESEHKERCRRSQSTECCHHPAIDQQCLLIYRLITLQATRIPLTSDITMTPQHTNSIPKKSKSNDTKMHFRKCYLNYYDTIMPLNTGFTPNVKLTINSFP